MSETQEDLKPLTKGAVKVGEKEVLNFPVAKMIKAHIEDGKFGQFPKEIEDEDGSKRTVMQNRVIYTIVIDDDIADVKTSESLLGKKVVKSITLSNHERATYPSFIAAVNGGEYSSDPADALNKPLQVMFEAWSEFGGNKYQPIKYLPPADGQTIKTQDETPTLDELFGDRDEVENG